MILVDTNIFVDHLRGYESAIKFFESIAPRGDVIFSAITETELVAGRESKFTNKKEQLLHFLHCWNKVPVSNNIAIKAGDITREYNLDIPDAIIAATALVNKAELLREVCKIVSYLS